MSMVMNKGVNMCCKVVMANLLTVVGILVKPSTAIEKLKGYLEASIYIRQPTITETFISTVIYSYLSSFLLYNSF